MVWLFKLIIERRWFILSSKSILKLLFTIVPALLMACSVDLKSQPTISASTPDPILATPQTQLGRVELQGNIPEIPNVLVISSSQSKAALADYLRTTPVQLDWVNPTLDDPIPPDTLVVIPPIYRVTKNEELADISQATRFSEQLLLEFNPKLDAQETLRKGTILVMPSLYIVPENTLLSGAAETIQVNSEELLSANPNLDESKEIMEGTVLVVPPKSEER